MHYIFPPLKQINIMLEMPSKHEKQQIRRSCKAQKIISPNLNLQFAKERSAANPLKLHISVPRHNKKYLYRASSPEIHGAGLSKHGALFVRHSYQVSKINEPNYFEIYTFLWHNSIFIRSYWRTPEARIRSNISSCINGSRT